MKKFLSMLLAVAMIVSLFATVSIASSADEALNGLVWCNDGAIRYYENGTPVVKGLVFYEGESDKTGYYFVNGSKKAVRDCYYAFTAANSNNHLPAGKYYFDADGKADVKVGLSWDVDGKIRYYEGGVPVVKGLVYYNGTARKTGYYFINSTKTAVKNCDYAFPADLSNGLKPAGKYHFGTDGRLVEKQSGLVMDENGDLRYYEDGNPIAKGLVFYNGSEDQTGYYYINSSKKAVKNCIYSFNATTANTLLPAGKYFFGADGRLVMNDGLSFDPDGEIRYYVDGQPIAKGLILYEGDYYFINSTRKAVKDCGYAFDDTNTAGLLPAGCYYFGADAKMIIKQGVYDDPDGEIRYYVDNVPVAAGLVEDGDNYYYFDSSLKALKDTSYHIYAPNNNNLLPEGVYYFNADGVLVDAGATVVSNEAELIAALGTIGNTDVISIANDIELTDPLATDKDVTINGNGHKVISGNTITFRSKFVSLNDIEFAAPGEMSTTKSSVYVYAPAEDVTITNCRFINMPYEAIQITSNKLKNVVITDNYFKNDLKGGYRYLHIQPMASGASTTTTAELTLTGNTFVNVSSEYVADSAVTITGIFFINMDIADNYVEGDGADDHQIAKYWICDGKNFNDLMPVYELEEKFIYVDTTPVVIVNETAEAKYDGVNDMVLTNAPTEPTEPGEEPAEPTVVAYVPATVAERFLGEELTEEEEEHGNVHDDNFALTVENVDIQSNSVTYDITLKNATHDIIISDAGEIIRVDIKIGAGLTGLVVKHDHNGEIITLTESDSEEADTFQYSFLTGILSIFTEKFSDFIVSYDGLNYPVAKTTELDASLYKARIYNIEELEATNVYEDLDVAYKFEAIDTLEAAKQSPYRYWHADYVVSFNKAVPAGIKAGLAGQYTGYGSDEDGWIGFYVPQALKANEEIRILGNKFFVNYEELCDYVRTFKCGAFDPENELTGTTMTVELRLYETTADATVDWEPGMGSVNEETGKYISVGKYNYTFD